MTHKQAKNRGKRLTARGADKHHLYELAVQRPSVIIGFIEHLAEMMQRREMVTLREDFCGTAFLSSMWAASAEGRKAIGVDCDEKVLAWARAQAAINERQAGSGGGGVKLVCDDVMAVNAKCDALAALNFSHGIYKTREAMLRYLRHARRCIRPGGLIVMDTFGGPGAMEPCTDERNFGQFVYQWEQVKFNPLTNEILCHIHFKFGDGSRIRKAFTYDWRLWSLPELREILLAAGFNDVGIWFEGEEGFIDEHDGMNDHAWVAYVVGFRD